MATNYTTIPMEVTKCLACEAPVMAYVQWEIQNPVYVDRQSAKADMRATGLRIDHNCIPRATR